MRRYFCACSYNIAHAQKLLLFSHVQAAGRARSEQRRLSRKMSDSMEFQRYTNQPGNQAGNRTGTLSVCGLELCIDRERSAMYRKLKIKFQYSVLKLD